jgi:IMP dehydrogenase/GMP reductase
MYSLDQIGLIPSVLSEVKSRGDVNPYVLSPFGGEKLPIFVAPMTCILNANNICTFSQSKVEPILPVCSGGQELRRQLPNGSMWRGWTALTLQEFDNIFIQNSPTEEPPYYILIDVANGHMKELFTKVRQAKEKYGDSIKIMLGNIANPETYIECCKARVDYVRVGIGGGAGCTTSVQTGIHTSMPWLLKCIREEKNRINWISGNPMPYDDEEILKLNGFRTKVVADGGVNTIARAIKCLALGADYVMMGKCFAECEEAGIGAYRYYSVKGRPPYTKQHLYYGQSSKEGQMDRFGKVKSNPEGVAKWVTVNTNLEEFTAHFEAALRSAMSYCNAHTLDEFIGKVRYEVMSPMEFNAFNK